MIEVHPLVVSAVIDDRRVLMAPDMRFLRLDRVGGEIWELLSAGADVGEVAEALRGAYGIDIERARADVVTFVGQLAAEGLVTVGTD